MSVLLVTAPKVEVSKTKPFNCDTALNENAAPFLRVPLNVHAKPERCIVADCSVVITPLSATVLYIALKQPAMCWQTLAGSVWSAHPVGPVSIGVSVCALGAKRVAHAVQFGAPPGADAPKLMYVWMTGGTSSAWTQTDDASTKIASEVRIVILCGQRM